MNLEEIKKRIEDIAKWYDVDPHLVAEVKLTIVGLVELETLKWEREKADLEAKLAIKMAEVGPLYELLASTQQQLVSSKEIQAAEKMILIAEIEKNTVLNEAICGMREASLTHDELNALASFVLQHGDLDSNAVGLTAMVLRGKANLLSSAPGCPHKERADKITAAELAEQARLINERDEARKQLAAVHAALEEERGKVMEGQ